MSSAGSGQATISWDQQQLQGSKCELVLYDIDDNVLIDMMSVNSYSFNDSERNFRIYYNIEGERLPNQVQLGAAYPNPSSSGVTIPVAFLTTDRESLVKLQIFDSRGAVVAELNQTNSGRGVHEITWDGQNAAGRRVQPGLYFFRIEASLHSQQSSTFSGKFFMN